MRVFIAKIERILGIADSILLVVDNFNAKQNLVLGKFVYFTILQWFDKMSFTSGEENL